MKLLFVIDHFGSGGAQRQMVNLARGLSQRGHIVDFFLYHPDFRFFMPLVEGTGITVWEHRKRGRLGLSVVLALRRRMIAGRYTSILSYLETPSVYAELARLGLGAVPLVVSERVDPPAGRSSIQLKIRALLHRLADSIVSNSHSCRREWSTRFPALSSRFTTIWNGLDLMHFAPAEWTPEVGGRLRVLAVGTLVPRKNAHGIVSAMIELKKSGAVVPDVTWIGKMDDTDEGQDYRELIDRTLIETGLSERWTWAGEQSDIEDRMRRSDVLVHASYREGLSNVICEALACGCPVIAADAGDNSLLVGEGERGMIFNPDSPGELADCLETFAELAPAARRKLRRAARDFAERELSIGRLVDQYEAHFKSVSRSA